MNKTKPNDTDLLELVKRCAGGQTWWMSDFYEGFCGLYGLDFNNIQLNVRRIRHELNRLVKAGKLEKQKLGTGYGGKGLFNSNSFTLWVLSEPLNQWRDGNLSNLQRLRNTV